MFNIENQCERVLKTFSLVLATNYKAAMYMLGNLYFFLPKQQGEAKKNVEQAIKSAKEKINKEAIVNFWNTIDSLKESDWKVMPHGNKESLFALRKNMLRDRFYFQHIDNQSLIKIGQNIDFTTEALIALVRKSLAIKFDPFESADFNYDLLKKGGVEENYLYFYDYFNKCKIIPVDIIASLGKENIKIADILLKAFSTTNHFFTISAKLSEYHPSLRANIAESWSTIHATHPLPPQQQKTNAEILNEMKAYPEFKEVNLNARVTSVHSRGNDLEPLSVWHYMNVGALGGGIAFAGLKATVCVCAGPAFLPFYFMGAGAGLGLACSNIQVVNDWEKNARKKVIRLLFG